MALVVIYGQPCSGKSTAALCLAVAVQGIEPISTGRIIDETSFHLDRNQSYADMTAEKNLRGVLSCRKWNEECRETGEASYDEKIFEDLVRRFEKPDGRNRWDSPLFELWPSKDGVEKSSLAILDAVLYLMKKVDTKTQDVRVLQPTVSNKKLHQFLRPILFMRWTERPKKLLMLSWKHNHRQLGTM